MRPTLEVLGVYLPREDPERVNKLIAARVLELGPTASKRRRAAESSYRNEIEGVALIEVAVHEPDASFTTDDFVQPDPTIDPTSWQVAWNEVFLSADGEFRIARESTPQLGSYRVAFYIHCWRAELGLRSSYGPLVYPAPREMPERLRKLAPYEFVE